jgi:hypothetical protein
MEGGLMPEVKLSSTMLQDLLNKDPRNVDITVEYLMRCQTLALIQILKKLEEMEEKKHV